MIYQRSYWGSTIQSTQQPNLENKSKAQHWTNYHQNIFRKYHSMSITWFENMIKISSKLLIHVANSILSQCVTQKVLPTPLTTKKNKQENIRLTFSDNQDHVTNSSTVCVSSKGCTQDDFVSQNHSFLIDCKETKSMPQATCEYNQWSYRI